MEKREFPEDLEQHSVFNPCSIEFSSFLSVPGWEYDSVTTLIEDEDTDNYFEVSGGTSNQIFGYATCVQNTMELKCELVTNGLNSSDSTEYQDSQRPELKKNSDDWILLLQIDSDFVEEVTGMMWGDAGKLYFWIRKQDLKNKDFGKVWCILQCH